MTQFFHLHLCNFASHVQSESEPTSKTNIRYTQEAFELSILHFTQAEDARLNKIKRSKNFQVFKSFKQNQLN